MRAPRKVLGGLLVCVGWVTTAGCTSHGGTNPAQPIDSVAGRGPTGDAQGDRITNRGAAIRQCAGGIGPADFSTDINNRYWPMKPGTRWTYREVAGRRKRFGGGGRRHH